MPGNRDTGNAGICSLYGCQVYRLESVRRVRVVLCAMAKTWHYKLVLLGDTAVGKSCLVVRFVRDEFFEFQEPTIGAAFLTQTVALDDTTVKFEIWDTAGQGESVFFFPLLVYMKAG